MKVFVTGGTGLLGSGTIARLLRHGHAVRALARSAVAAERLRQLGAQPILGDLFDAGGPSSAMAGSDVVIHLATHIPPVMQLGRLSAWQENDRIRREGTRNLVDAALAAGVAAFVYESVVLVYADAGSEWIEAGTARLDPAPQARSSVDAEQEVTRFAAAGGRGVSLRLGLLYSPADEQSRVFRWMIRFRLAPVVGAADAYWPALWAADAAEAFVAAAQSTVSGVFDIVDDRPLTRRELRIAMEHAAGHRLLRLPDPAGRLAFSGLWDALTRSLRVSNQRFRAETGWRPDIPSAEEGWARVLRY